MREWTAHRAKPAHAPLAICLVFSSRGSHPASLFAKAGAYTFITGGRKKELDEALKTIGSDVSDVQGDVANLADSRSSLCEAVADVKWRIDMVQTVTLRATGWSQFCDQ